jgi:cell division protein FtsB
MNPFEFVITLMVVIFAFRIISHRMGMRTGMDRRWANQQLEAGDPRETSRLRDEVKELKERIKVLERITVDKENSLSRQIEELRDR